MADKEKLFSEFPPVSKQKWEEVILKELKGADYEKKLMWKSPEGIIIKPYYTKEDLPNYKQNTNDIPIYRTSKHDFNWIIFEEVYVSNIEKANLQATDALKRGAEGIEFIIQEKVHHDLTNIFPNHNSFSKLLQNIQLETTPIRFICCCNSGLILSLLEEELKIQKIDKSKINITVDNDPIGHFTTNGNFFTNEEHTFKQMQSLLNYANNSINGNGKYIAIEGNIFQNAGATVLQELAFSLAISAEYLTRLAELGEKVEDTAQRISFNMGVASNYFLEIAKFRALRYLWSKLLEAYNPSIKNIPVYVHAVTSTWNKTAYDPYVNLLRLTTEAMSAVIGGADSLTVRPFDVVYKSPDAFSQRLSRNIQLLLKEEVHLDRVIDPAGGSYYIESLTYSIIVEAWNMFLQIQEMGGYIQAFKEGKIQQMIKETVQKRNTNIALRQEILLGTNQYPNLKEQIHSQINPCKLKPTPTLDKPLYEPISIERGSQSFENLRLETERLPKRPKVFLLTYGNLAMRKARANFTINFFGCAGYDVIDNPGFSTIEEGIEEAIKSDAEIVVICSSDEEYPVTVPTIISQLNNNKIVVLAGYPKEHVETFKELGLKYFIHIKSNVLETLKNFNAIIKERVSC